MGTRSLWATTIIFILFSVAFNPLFNIETDDDVAPSSPSQNGVSETLFGQDFGSEETTPSFIPIPQPESRSTISNFVEVSVNTNTHTVHGSQASMYLSTNVPGLNEYSDVPYMVGELNMTELAQAGPQNTLDAMSITDHFFSRFRYELALLWVEMYATSIHEWTDYLNNVVGAGVQNYIDLIEASDSNAFPMINGTEIGPYYFWTGSPLGSPPTLTNNNWYKHLVLLGIPNATIWEALPTMSNGNPFGWDVDSDEEANPNSPDPYQQFIDWVNEQSDETLIIWSKPSHLYNYTSNNASMYTPPHPEDIWETNNHNGFEVFNGEVQWSAVPYWDMVLEDYCSYGSMGNHTEPIWAFGGADYHNTPIFDLVDNGRNGVFVPPSCVGTSTFKEEIMNALRSGRFYAANGSDSQFRLNDFSLVDAPDGDCAIMGEWLPCNGEATVNIDLTSSSPIVLVNVTRNGTLVASFSPNTPSFSMSFQDDHYTLERSYYRLEAFNQMGQCIFANPIFVDFQPRKPELFVADEDVDIQGDLIDTYPLHINTTLHNPVLKDELGVTVRLLVDGVQENQTQVDFGPNSTVRVNFTWIASSGDHLIMISLDPDDMISELIEGNNNASEQVNISTLPDLVVSQLIITPAPLVHGRSALINADVLNLGETDAPSFQVRLEIDGAMISSDLISIQSGSLSHVEFTWDDPQKGDHTITVIADHTDVITESNEMNNTKTSNITVLGHPDLTVNSSFIQVVSSTYPIREGNVVYFICEVFNVGDQNVTLFEVEVRIDDQVVRSESLGLAPISNTTFEHQWTAVEGNHTISFSLDPSDLVEEANEMNNTAELLLSVEPPPRKILPDLSVDSIVLPSDFKSGDSISVLGDFSYVNISSLISNIEFRFLINDTEVGKRTIDVSARATQVSFPWKVENGAQVLSIEVDPNDLVQESNEDNNAKSIKVTVTDDGVVIDDNDDDGPGPPPTWLPDLMADPSTLVSAPQEIHVGDQVEFSIVAFSNNQTQQTLVNISWAVDGWIMLSEQHMFGTDSYELYYIWNATLGSHRISFYLDPENALLESNEHNNVASIEIQVTEASNPDGNKDENGTEGFRGGASLYWYIWLIIALVIFLLLYFWVIRPKSKHRRARMEYIAPPPEIWTDIDEPTLEPPMATEIDVPVADQTMADELDVPIIDPPMATEFDASILDPPIASEVDAPMATTTMAIGVVDPMATTDLATEVEPPMAYTPMATEVDAPSQNHRMATEVEPPKANHTMATEIDAPLANHRMATEVHPPVANHNTAAKTDTSLATFLVASTYDGPFGDPPIANGLAEAPVHNNALPPSKVLALPPATQPGSMQPPMAVPMAKEIP